MERDTPTQVKAIQAKWQVEAKAVPLAQRDERALWEEFRAACDAVFTARHAKRKEEDDRRQARRKEDDERRHGKEQAQEEVVAALEQLRNATDKDDAEIRRALRDAQEQWKQRTGRADAPSSAIEARFRNAKAAVETMLSTRSRSREAAVWQALASKERLCEELDQSVLSGAIPGDTGSEHPASPAGRRFPACQAHPSRR